MTRSEIEARVACTVLAVHRRNGGTLTALDVSLPILDPRLGLDSLDLAEIMACLEKETGVSPFERGRPRIWAEVITLLSSG